MKYEIWSNTSSDAGRWFSGYQPAHSMKKSWEGELAPVGNPLEHLFMKFNMDDRPNGQVAHSLSVGDVVVLDGTAHAVQAIGFTQLPTFTPVIGDYDRR